MPIEVPPSVEAQLLAACEAARDFCESLPDMSISNRGKMLHHQLEAAIKLAKGE
jgi:hypothetical protein